ncbi:MAG: hypothetical protein ACYTEO_02700 [Planctomycetota bacterium]|jgi:hypothetical protein
MTFISVLVRLENSRQVRKPDGMCLPVQVLNVREHNGLSALTDRLVKVNTEGDEVKNRGTGS